MPLNIKRTPGEKLADIIILVLSILVIIVILYPLLFVLFASFSDPRQIWDKPPPLFPAGFNLDSYAKVFENSEIWRGYANTLLYAFIGTAINIMMTVFGAYPLSRKRFTARDCLRRCLLSPCFSAVD